MPSLYSTIKCGLPISALCDGSVRISSKPWSRRCCSKYPVRGLSLEETEDAESAALP
ncbi:rCG20634 [Rattus norvegicus]|uniref:RCG20634 n=1 Tax=Rattus norvegicus TaxID=10116 RepID=A6JED7_RAT|nr:rCG20634 [Rattus norvegicus]